MTLIDEFISERIRMFRLSNRYSQEDIGKYLKLPKQSISRIENNQRKVSSNELAKLAKFFKISINDFSITVFMKLHNKTDLV